MVDEIEERAVEQFAGLSPARERRPLALDAWLTLLAAAGLGFSLAALLHARRSPYPRSDAFGAGLLGAILSVLAAAILLLRVVALT